MDHFQISVEINFASCCNLGLLASAQPWPSGSGLAAVAHTQPCKLISSITRQFFSHATPRGFSRVLSNQNVNYICLSVAVSAGENHPPCLASACRKSVTTLSIITPPSRQTRDLYVLQGAPGVRIAITLQPFIGLGVHSALTLASPNECVAIYKL